MNYLNKSLKTYLFIFIIVVMSLSGINLVTANENILYPVYISQKGGYINKTGEIKIPARFDYVGNFSEGVASVKKDGKNFIIDTTGKIVSSPDIEDYILGIHEFKSGIALVSLLQEKLFINKKGQKLFGQVYDDARDFSNGLAAVKIDGKWGFIDEHGKLKIANKFDYVESFLTQFAPVRVNKKWDIINTTGQILTKHSFLFVYGGTELPFQSAVNGHPAYIDQYGDEIIGISCERFGCFSEGFADIYRDGKAGFIDLKGNIVIPCQFENTRPFSEGMAGIQIGGKWGFINKEGEIKIQPRFDDVGPFQKGLARVWIYGEDHNAYGYINQDGVIVWEPSR